MARFLPVDVIGAAVESQAEVVGPELDIALLGGNCLTTSVGDGIHRPMLQTPAEPVAVPVGLTSVFPWLLPVTVFVNGARPCWPNGNVSSRETGRAESLP